MEPRQRKWWVAALLTLLTPGLGHVYDGELKRGSFLLFLLILSVIPILPLSLFPLPFASNLYVPVFLPVCVFLYVFTDAIGIARKKSEGYQLKPYNKWYVYLGIFVALTLADRALVRPAIQATIRTHLVESFRFPTTSMMPTLVNGDHILVNKCTYGSKLPQRGDVVAFLGPVEREKVFVKRVIGLPGENIKIMDRQVYINGHPIDESGYTYFSGPNPVPALDNYGPLEIPADSYFVMGDNRENSADSRVWGPVPGELIKGKAFQIYWSWNNSQQAVRWERIGRRIR